MDKLNPEEYKKLAAEFEEYKKTMLKKPYREGIEQEGREDLRIAERGGNTIYAEAQKAPKAEVDLYQTLLTAQELKDLIMDLKDAKSLVEDSLGDREIYGFSDPQNTTLSEVIVHRERLPDYLDEAIDILETAEGPNLDKEAKLSDLPDEFDKAIIIHQEKLKAKGSGEQAQEETDMQQEAEMTPSTLMEDIAQLAQDRKIVLAYLDKANTPFFEYPDKATLGQVRKDWKVLPPELGVLFGGTERYKELPDDLLLENLPDAIMEMTRKQQKKLFQIADEYQKRKEQEEGE